MKGVTVKEGGNVVQDREFLRNVIYREMTIPYNGSCGKE